MSSSLLKTLLGVCIVAALLLAVFAADPVRADDDDEIEDAGNAGGADAGGADAGGEKPLGFGLNAGVIFPKNRDAGPVPVTPAGETVEALIAITNLPANPEYTAVWIAAQLHPLNDFSRTYMNFTGNPYKRVLAAGQHTTIKYAFTPLAEVEAMEYSLVIRVFIQPSNDVNSTFAIAAYNSTIVINEHLGTDPRSIGLILTAVALIGGFVYYKQNSKDESIAAKEKRNQANQIEVGRNVKVDADFFPKEHIEYLERMKEKQLARSKSPKQ